MTTETGYVYTLSDPRTDEVRYVGATRNPEQRLKSHIHAPHSAELAGWVDELKRDNHEPKMQIINVAGVEDLSEKERSAFQRLSDRFELLNSKTSPNYTDPHRHDRGEPEELLDRTTRAGLRVDPLMDEILNHLVDGRATTGALVDWTETTRATVTKRLDKLKSADCIEYAHKPTALWVIVDDPRDTEATDE